MSSFWRCSYYGCIWCSGCSICNSCGRKSLAKVSISPELVWVTSVVKQTNLSSYGVKYGRFGPHFFSISAFTSWFVATIPSGGRSHGNVTSIVCSRQDWVDGAEVPECGEHNTETWCPGLYVCIVNSMGVSHYNFMLGRTDTYVIFRHERNITEKLDI